MHDCPTCKVPLHGHEEVCPSCGTPQRRRRSYSKMLGEESRKPPINLLPIVGAIMAVIVGLIVMAQGSWVGQLMNKKPQPEDPMAKVTYLDARQIIEGKITEGVTGIGGTATFKWLRGGAEVDKNSEGPVEVNCEVALQDKEQRHQIVDPVKDYFEKAQITTFTMNDPKLKATWTYTVSPPVQTGATSPEGAQNAAPPAEQ